jgi:hypothetical protein
MSLSAQSDSIFGGFDLTFVPSQPYFFIFRSLHSHQSTAMPKLGFAHCSALKIQMARQHLARLIAQDARRGVVARTL